MVFKVTVPGHITGFFAARDHPDPLRKGSIGCGLTLTVGATTTASSALETMVLLNGKPSPAPVSRFVIDELARSPVLVKTDLSVPMGAGFGASGAGALGCAYALNLHNDLGLTAERLGAVAHRAEVAFSTGLGDVIGQITGGLVMRLRPGAPGVGRVDRIPVPPFRIYYVVRGPISTKDVLTDPGAMAEINRSGEASLKELLARPTLKNFMRISRRFTKEIGLASDWVLDAIEAVDAKGGLASMIMLGDAVFAIAGSEAGSEELLSMEKSREYERLDDKLTGTAELADVLSTFGEVKTAAISQVGVHID